MTHGELKSKAFSHPKVKVAYDEMASEFAFLRQMLNAGQIAGLGQPDLAEYTCTKAPSVTRLEFYLAGKTSTE